MLFEMKVALSDFGVNDFVMETKFGI